MNYDNTQQKWKIMNNEQQYSNEQYIVHNEQCTKITMHNIYTTTMCNDNNNNAHCTMPTITILLQLEQWNEKCNNAQGLECKMATINYNNNEQW